MTYCRTFSKMQLNAKEFSHLETVSVFFIILSRLSTLGFVKLGLFCFFVFFAVPACH